MRIGIFTDGYYPNISGVVTSVAMLKEGLTKKGHDVFVFTYSTEKSKTLYTIEDNVIKIKGVKPPFKALKDYRISFTSRKLLKLIKSFNLDLIHIQTEFCMGRLGTKAARKFNIPMVYTLHTLYEDYLKYISAKFDKKHHDFFLDKATNVLIKPINKVSMIDIVPTKKVLLQAPKYKLSGDIRVVPTGIDLDRFNLALFKDNEIALKRSELGLTNDDFVFLYLGRISEEKSTDIIARAFAENLKGISNVKMLVVGDGPYKETLVDLVKSLGIDDQFIFTGFIPWKEIPVYYHLSDIFVNASSSETQGLTYIEALASSCPVLVQKDPCLDDVVVDYYNGIYFDGESDLSIRMKELSSKPKILSQIRINSAKSVENYSKLCYANNIESLYLDAIEMHQTNLIKK